MHELSIASAILERAKAVSEKNQNARVTKVAVRIGELSGVESDALRFGFEALCKGTPMEVTALDIEFCKRKQQCQGCGAKFEPESYITTCPRCGGDHSV